VTAPACATRASNCSAPSTDGPGWRSTRAGRGRAPTGASPSSSRASSRTLLLRYRRHAADTVAAAQARLRLRVRAGVALALAPPAAGRGAVALAGRVVGRPLPHTRKLVELQARRPGHSWVTVRVLRAGLDGRFTARYTPSRGGRRDLRAVVRAAADYPYATGASRPIRVVG
jgi:hypothetical protein